MNTDLYYFYGYWQIIVCSFAFLALLSIWRHITRGEDWRERDFGLVWLAVAVMMWAFSGILEVQQARALGGPQAFNPFPYEGLKSMLSIFNSAFILLALPRFRHIPRIVFPIVRSESWRLLVWITFIFAVLLTLLMLLGAVVPTKTTFVYSVDFIYAVFTLFFLGLVLWASFARRQLKSLSYLSAISILFTLAAQVLKLGGPEFWKILISSAFKTILIMLFFALALSWIEELSKAFYRTRPQEMHALLLKKKTRLQKLEYLLVLTVPPRIQTQQIQLTEKNFQLFQTFAQKRKTSGADAGWLEIQPKSGPPKTYDIKDYNQISRLLDAILNECFGLGGWTAEADKKPLKEALFEYGANRKIRLRMAPGNISMEGE